MTFSTPLGQHLAPDGEVGNGGAGDAEGRHAGSDRSEVDLWRWGQRGGWGGVARALLRRRGGWTCVAAAPLSRCVPGPAQLVGGGFVDAEEPVSGHVGEHRGRSVPQAHAEADVADASRHHSVAVDDVCVFGLLPCVPRHAKKQHFVPGLEHATCVAVWPHCALDLEFVACAAAWLCVASVGAQSFETTEPLRCPFCSFACASDVVHVRFRNELQ